ncbi:MAG: acyl-CoA dehydrogenase, partial [Alphaproteobacteria bacterium]|nr:acyl-CoA dehydrogenase [Alphaproteobacteria bacterium]
MTALLPYLIPICAEALAAIEAHRDRARAAVARRVGADGRIDSQKLDAEQYAAHGFAWIATYATALRELLAWARRLEAAGTLGEREALILQIVFGEYAAQLRGGIPISQVEMTRAADV